jgi:hypothetical protein
MKAGKVTAISDELVDQALRDHWDQIAFTAYDQFLKAGRGWVLLEQDRESDEGIRIGYAVFNGNEPNFDPALVRMVQEYDPDLELVLQYMRGDREIRQMRLRPGPHSPFPRKSWIIGILNKNDPEGDKLLDIFFMK